MGFLRMILSVTAAGLLTSCTLLQAVEESPAAPGPQPAQAPAAVPAAAEQSATASPSAEDPGINREGRVIQLGVFVEETPAIDLPENDVIELNYEQESLRTVFEQLGDALQISLIIDPTIDATVSIRTAPANPLRYADIWPLMRTLARNAGLVIEQVGNNLYQIVPGQVNIPVEIVTPGGLDAAISSEVLQVTPLRFISVDTAETILTPLLQEDDEGGGIIRLGVRSLIGIYGTPAQLARVNAMLAIIDDDPFQNQGIRLYELTNSSAAEVADELTAILQLIEGEFAAYQVLGLARINSVLVIAPATRGFDEVDRWIDILDAESQEQVEQLFLYEVKNLNAVTLADTLTRVFDRDDEIVPVNDDDTQAVQAGGAVVLDAGDGQAAVQTAQQAQPEPQNQTASQAGVAANLAVTIVADEDTNSLLIRATPRDYRQLLTIINNLDRLPRQVLINAVIGQVTLSDGSQFGIDWSRVSGNLASGPAQISSNVLPENVFDAGGQPAAGSGLVFTRSFTDGSAIIDVTLQALAQNNDVRLLARPTITATNNQEGSIVVGQDVPVDLGSTISGNGVVTSNISYRDVGIVLTITPQINTDGFINLVIQQSLSSVEDSAGGVSNNPIFTNQEITTTAVVADQSLVVLGGLIQETDTSQNTGLIGLKDIPVLGGLFSLQERGTERRELFVILRPQIINAEEENTALMDEYRRQFESVAELFDEAGIQ